ncbi:MAG TPA: DUF2147 domain-containing protein [Stellaceae bacterium]|nr:DUF2147 domain-containing protein [Stellaceae bacterium]
MWSAAATAATLAILLAASAVAHAAAPIEGSWLTEGKSGIVEIFRCGGGDGLCGRLAWVRIKPSDNNPQGIDNRNPSPGLRSRPLCGLTIMWGFRADGAGHWNDGTIYDPQSGNTYRAEMTMRPDGSLGVRGYVLLSLFGRSEIWTRFAPPIPPCPAR